MTSAQLTFNSIWEYEQLASTVEYHVQKVLEEHNYNTVGNFLRLYEGFKASGCSNLSEYYQSYTPPITSKHHTCVGLALELKRRLSRLAKRDFPQLSKSLYLTSCEEGIDPLGYLALFENIDDVSTCLDKEHVLLAGKFEIDGRRGVFLCDPGYHVGRVITVMEDLNYPHTGWFMQSEENAISKEYNYNFSPINDNFIEWTERTTKSGVQHTFTALIYVKCAYLTAVDVTERRNLVYNFRSLLSRNTKGRLKAGIYFKIKEKSSDEFTLFYHDVAKQRVVLNFNAFLHPEMVNENILKAVKKCNDQLNLKDNELIEVIKSIAEVLGDKNYVNQLLEINNCVNVMAENN